jgi:hypothetical protein
MNTPVNTIPIIEKELLDILKFPQQDVLSDTEKIEHRKYEARRATKLGNSFKDKVKIVFEDIEGKKMVETTVWGISDRYLMLKRGLILPLYRVHEIII